MNSKNNDLTDPAPRLPECSVKVASIPWTYVEGVRFSSLRPNTEEVI